MEDKVPDCNVNYRKNNQVLNVSYRNEDLTAVIHQMLQQENTFYYGAIGHKDQQKYVLSCTRGCELPTV